MATVCSHIAEHLKKVKPRTKGCEECLASGDTWLHLRMCLECGHVGCCAGAFSWDGAPTDPIRRAWRGLALVLHR